MLIKTQELKRVPGPHTVTRETTLALLALFASFSIFFKCTVASLRTVLTIIDCSRMRGRLYA